MCSTNHPAKLLCKTSVLLVEARFSAGRQFFFLGKTPPKHAVEPRDRPCRPRAPQNIGVRSSVRVRFEVGLDLGRRAR